MNTQGAKVAKLSGIFLIAAFLMLAFSSIAFAVPGDWWGYAIVTTANGTYNATNGTPLYVYLSNGTLAKNTTIGGLVSGMYLVHIVANTSLNVSFQLCYKNVSDSPQPWSQGNHPQFDLHLTDTAAPNITNTAPSGVLTSSAVTISFNTDEYAVCRFSTSSSALNYSSNMSNMTTTSGTAHSLSITLPNAEYAYYIKCMDCLGNINSDPKNITFTVSVASPELTGCAYSNPACGSGYNCVNNVCVAVTPPSTPTTPVTQPVTPPPTPPTTECTNTCPTDYTRTAYPDCTCVAPPGANVTTPDAVQIQQTLTDAQTAITQGDSASASTLLTSAIDGINTLSTSGAAAESSQLLSSTIIQTNALIAINPTAAQTVLTAQVAAITQLASTTTTTINNIVGTGSIQSILSLSDLGLTASDIQTAQTNLQQAAQLIQQAETTTDTLQKQQLLVQANNLQAEALAALPEIVVKAVASDTVQSSSSSLQQALSQATSSEAKSVLQSIQSQLPDSASVFTITRNLKSYEITNKEKTDAIVDKTKIDLVITVNTPMGNVTIVESIPKSVANDISSILFPGVQPTILQADPIVSWTFPSIKPGETKNLSYIVAGKVDSLDSVTVAGGVKTGIGPAPPVTPPTNVTPGPTPTKPADYTTLIVIVVVVVIVAIAFVLLRGRGAKPWSPKSIRKK